jgi:hypothetical protein
MTAVSPQERNGSPVWVCDDRVIGRSGMSVTSEVAKSLTAIGRAGIEFIIYPRPGQA